MKALVVDDEPLARDLMSRMLAAAKVDVVGQAGDASEALRLAEELQPDLVFLDIRMPGMNGLEASSLFAHAESAPLVVFVTGYSEHAVEAFKQSAIDYLLKPVSEERLALCLAKARKQLALRRKATKIDALRKVASQAPVQRLAIRVRGSIRLIPLEKILYAIATKKQVTIKTREGEFRSSHTLAWLEGFFPPLFMRTHSSCIVNLAAIQEILVLGNHSYAIVLVTGEELPLSRQQYRELQQKLGFSEGG